jgi:hypothetical protein
MNVGERTSRLRVVATTTRPRCDGSRGSPDRRRSQSPGLHSADHRRDTPVLTLVSPAAEAPVCRLLSPWMTTTRMPGRELLAVACRAAAVPAHSGLSTSDQIVRIDLDPVVSSR